MWAYPFYYRPFDSFDNLYPGASEYSVLTGLVLCLELGFGKEVCEFLEHSIAGWTPLHLPQMWSWLHPMQSLSH